MIVYASRTGNVRYIVSKLKAQKAEITQDLIMDKPYLLITYTDGLGDVPPIVQQFIERNHHYCRGVAVSGNTNFGPRLFGVAGDKLSQRYNIPIVRKIELRGFSADYEAIQHFYETKVRA